MKNREIKFRVWEKNRKEFEYINSLYWFEENYVHSFKDIRYQFQQFTNLLDINGEEIYEGDILIEYPDNGIKTEIPQEYGADYKVFEVNYEKRTPLKDLILNKGQVKFDGTFGYGFLFEYFQQNEHGVKSARLEFTANYEVVGNIFENKDLLN